MEQVEEDELQAVGKLLVCWPFLHLVLHLQNPVSPASMLSPLRRLWKFKSSFDAVLRGRFEIFEILVAIEMTGVSRFIVCVDGGDLQSIMHLMCT